MAHSTKRGRDMTRVSMQELAAAACMRYGYSVYCLYSERVVLLCSMQRSLMNKTVCAARRELIGDDQAAHCRCHHTCRVLALSSYSLVCNNKEPAVIDGPGGSHRLAIACSRASILNAGRTSHYCEVVLLATTNGDGHHRTEAQARRYACTV
eukprot:scaffold44334_cov22-Prasinocladus_malaysianus.AAC.1